MKLFFLIICCMYTLQCFAQTKVIISQKNVVYSLEGENNTVELNRDSIKLWLPTKYNKNNALVSASVAILPYPADPESAQIGFKIDSISFYQSGKALSGDLVIGYDYFTIDPDAFFNVFWDNEKEHFANRFIIKEKDTFLEWNLFTYIDTYARLESPITALTNLDAMYMVIVIDFNENNIIDQGELWKIKIQFKN